MSTHQILSLRPSTHCIYVPDIELPLIIVQTCSQRNELTNLPFSSITLRIWFTTSSKRNTTIRKCSRSGWPTAASFYTFWNPIDTYQHLVCKRRRCWQSAFRRHSRVSCQFSNLNSRRPSISSCRRTSIMIRQRDSFSRCSAQRWHCYEDVVWMQH